SINADYPTGGFTALMWAARNGDEAIVRRLVAAGADLDLVNGDGATAMMIAIVNDRFDMAALLLELGAGVDDGSLYYAVEMRDATTDWFARDGSRLRPDHPNEHTALDLIRLLLEAGADPNATVAESGNTVMHEAVRLRKPEVIRVLAEAGVNLDAKNREGLTPLELAEGLDDTPSLILPNEERPPREAIVAVMREVRAAREQGSVR